MDEKLVDRKRDALAEKMDILESKTADSDKYAKRIRSELLRLRCALQETSRMRVLSGLCEEFNSLLLRVSGSIWIDGLYMD